MSNDLERLAQAGEEAHFGFGYQIKLTRLVDGVSTYELRYDDRDEAVEFDDYPDANAHVRQRQSVDRVRAILTALRSPSDAVVEAVARGIYGDLPMDMLSEDTRETMSAVARAAITAFIDAYTGGSGE